MGVFPRAPVTNGITLSFMFYMFLNSRAKFWWCSVFSDSLVCTLSSKIYYLAKLFIFLWYLVCSHTFPDTFGMWSPIVSYIYYFPLLPSACASTTFLSLLSYIFYIFSNGSSFQTNDVIFYTPSGLTCCIYLTHYLDSPAFSHILHLLYFWVLSIFAFMLLVLIACLCAAIIKASVVLFKHPFLSHPHWSSLALLIVCLINCACNCFCAHYVFSFHYFFSFCTLLAFLYLHLLLLFM